MSSVASFPLGLGVLASSGDNNWLGNTGDSTNVRQSMGAAYYGNRVAYLNSGSAYGYLRVIDTVTGDVVLNKRLDYGVTVSSYGISMDATNVYYSVIVSGSTGYVGCINITAGTKTWEKTWSYASNGTGPAIVNGPAEGSYLHVMCYNTYPRIAALNKSDGSIAYQRYISAGVTNSVVTRYMFASSDALYISQIDNMNAYGHLTKWSHDLQTLSWAKLLRPSAAMSNGFYVAYADSSDVLLVSNMTGYRGVSVVAASNGSTTTNWRMFSDNDASASSRAVKYADGSYGLPVSWGSAPNTGRIYLMDSSLNYVSHRTVSATGNGARGLLLMPNGAALAARLDGSSNFIPIVLAPDAAQTRGNTVTFADATSLGVTKGTGATNTTATAAGGPGTATNSADSGTVTNSTSGLSSISSAPDVVLATSWA